MKTLPCRDLNVFKILMHPAVNTSTSIGCEKDDGTEAFLNCFQ